ncbi:MAG TPA: hypothetical protein VIV06_12440, partial [Candidatus Limnocylindrales bacterium]
VAALARQLRETPGLDQAAEQALARALRLLEPGTAAEAGAAAEPGSAAEEGAAAEAESPEPEAPAESEPLAPPEPPSDPIALRASADEALDRGDGGAAREALLSAARAHAADGGYDAALDACYLALAVAPGDADLHLELVDLYLARGWRAPAAEKLVLLERLLELDGDEESRGRVRAIAAAAFPDDPNLAALRS